MPKAKLMRKQTWVKEKAYPFGPTCTYNGKEIPCLVYGSPHGGITGPILVSVLAEFDARDIFPRVMGITPTLVVDGHQSRLDREFLNYINDNNHRWKVCLGVPYATSLWQVGDSSEQNGAAKQEWYREKDRFLKFKNSIGHPLVLTACDVIPIVNKFFHKVYGNVKANKKALADRGWYPANRALVLHPSLNRDERKKRHQRRLEHGGGDRRYIA